MLASFLTVPGEVSQADPDALGPQLVVGLIALLLALLPFLLPAVALIVLCLKTVATLSESEGTS